MRLVDQSTRATIRTLTVIAAVTALLLTMFSFAPTTAYAVSLGDWDTSASGPLPYTNFDDPDNDYGAHAPQAAVKVHTSGNTNCTDLDGATQREVKFEVRGGSFVLEGDDNHGVVLTNVYAGTVTDGDEIRTWTFVDFVSPDQPVTSVFVKQSSGGVWFNYGTATSSGDHHLHSQDQGGPDGGIDAISHISFCFGEVTPPPPAPATLTIVKQVINDDAGTATATEFDIRINNGDPVVLASETAADGFDSQASWTGDVEPGERTITEDTFSGYSLVSIDCGNESNMVNLDAGESATCTVINNDNPITPVNPTVTLVKTVDNTNGGTLEASDFPVFVNDDPVSWGVAITVTPGEHVMSETQQPGYLAGSWGGDCAADGTLTTVTDTNYTCTITNTALAAGLTIVKQVAIGDLDASAFPLLITDADGLTQTVTSGQVTALPAGTYTIGETQQEGYELVSISCDNDVAAAEGEDTVTVTVGLNETVICTIVNAEITVLPVVVDQPETIVQPEIIVVQPEVEVLDEVIVQPEVEVQPEVAVLDDVMVLDEVAVLDEVVVLDAAQQLPATGLDTMRLTLLSALIAALGVMFLLGTSPAPAMGRRRRG